MLGSPLLGLAASRFGTKVALLLGLSLQVVSYLLYSFILPLGLDPLPSLVLVSGTRLLAGLGMGLLAVVLAFVAESTTAAARVTYTASIEVTAALAFMIGPGLSLLVSLLPNARLPWFVFDSTTSPAVLGAVVGGILTVVTAAMFQNTGPLARDYSVRAIAPAGALLAADFADDDDDDDDNGSRQSPPELVTATLVDGDGGSRQRNVLISVLAVVAFLQNNGLSVYETVSVPLLEDDYDFHVVESSVVWTSIGASSCFGLFILKLLARLRKKNEANAVTLPPPWHRRWLPSEYAWLLVNFCLTGLGFFLIAVVARPSLPLFCVGSFLVGSNYPPASAGLSAEYTKVVGVKKKTKQGFTAGLFYASAAAARLVGPLFSAPLYQTFHSSPIFAITFGFFTVSFLLLVVIRGKIKRLINL